MQQTLSTRNLFAMGFMVFAMFLGAGNLIFPVMVGQLAGENAWLAATGFLMTGVGLPLLGLLAIAQVGGHFNAIAPELPRWLIVVMGSCIFLIIGPLYAVPRTAMVAYEIGCLPFLETAGPISRLLFGLVFFGISGYLCLRPGQLLESIGKLITPALLLLLAILGVSPLIQPLSQPGDPLQEYAQSPLLQGFLQGYMTMDALAALMFGIVIVTNLQSHGITDRQGLLRYSTSTGIIAAMGLALVYISLFYLGATSRDVAPTVDNGGQLLALYVEHVFGYVGNLLLAGVVTLACLTTAVGCITAASEYFEELGVLSYPWLVTGISLICIVLASLGLNQIIALFVPVLLLLYPICIMLVMLGLIRRCLPNTVLTYRATLAVTCCFSLLDAINALSPHLSARVQLCLDSLFSIVTALPGFHSQMSWLLPSVLCLLITVAIGGLAKRHDYPAQT